MKLTNSRSILVTHVGLAFKFPSDLLHPWWPWEHFWGANGNPTWSPWWFHVRPGSCFLKTWHRRHGAHRTFVQLHQQQRYYQQQRYIERWLNIFIYSHITTVVEICRDVTDITRMTGFPSSDHSFGCISICWSLLLFQILDHQTWTLLGHFSVDPSLIPWGASGSGRRPMAQFSEEGKQCRWWNHERRKVLATACSTTDEDVKYLEKPWCLQCSTHKFCKDMHSILGNAIRPPWQCTRSAEVSDCVDALMLTVRAEVRRHPNFWSNREVAWEVACSNIFLGKICWFGVR